jgi:hypothetical protein
LVAVPFVLNARKDGDELIDDGEMLYVRICMF